MRKGSHADVQWPCSMNLSSYCWTSRTISLWNWTGRCRFWNKIFLASFMLLFKKPTNILGEVITLWFTNFQSSFVKRRKSPSQKQVIDIYKWCGYYQHNSVLDNTHCQRKRNSVVMAFDYEQVFLTDWVSWVRSGFVQVRAPFCYLLFSFISL